MEKSTLSFSVTGTLSEIETICGRVAAGNVKGEILSTREEAEEAVAPPKRKRKAEPEEEEEEAPKAKRPRKTDTDDDAPTGKMIRKKKADDDDRPEKTTKKVTLESLRDSVNKKIEEVGEQAVDELFNKYDIARLSQLEEDYYEEFYKKLKAL